MNFIERQKLIYHPRIWQLTDALMPMLHSARSFIIQKDYIANDVAQIVQYHGYFPEARERLIKDLTHDIQKFFDVPLTEEQHKFIVEKVNYFLDTKDLDAECRE